MKYQLFVRYSLNLEDTKVFFNLMTIIIIYVRNYTMYQLKFTLSLFILTSLSLIILFFKFLLSHRLTAEAINEPNTRCRIEQLSLTILDSGCFAIEKGRSLNYLFNSYIQFIQPNRIDTKTSRLSSAPKPKYSNRNSVKVEVIY